MEIHDATGTGRAVGVTYDNRLLTEAVTLELQHHYSRDEKQVYQAMYPNTTIATGTDVLLHLENLSGTKDLVITYLRMQVITASTLPAATEYFSVNFGETYVSGGVSTDPVNVNRGSGNTALVNCYGDTPVLTGAPVDIERLYNEGSGKEYTYSKHGSLILTQGEALTIKYTGAGAGVGKARITFVVMDRE
jgi:hypothetical protein